jgi:hypothetical protein
MKPIRLLLIVAGGLALTLALLAALNPPHPETAHAAPAAAFRYVLDNGGTDDSNCTNSQDPCQTIQYALGQANDEDTIRVANKDYPAIYAGTVFITKSVTLEGGWAVVGIPLGLLWSRNIPCEPFRTTLDGQGAGRVISITGDITPVIDCFTITSGDASGLGGGLDGDDAGGGIYSRDAAPIITNNVITRNYGCDMACSAPGRGGGIYLLNAPATAVISGNLIVGNVADDQTWGKGGGILLRNSDAQVLDNTIVYNQAGYTAGDGGGIAVIGGSPIIASNIITWNVASPAGQGNGGAIYVRSTSPLTVEGNLIQCNKALHGVGDAGKISRGGGIYIVGDPTVSALIRDNTILDNVASPAGSLGEGGGIYLKGLVAPSQASGNTLEENIAGYNEDGFGGGIYVDDSEATIADNHIFRNYATWAHTHGEGGGLYLNGGNVLLQSNVITNNSGHAFGFPSTATGFGGGVVISGSVANVQDNWIVGNKATNGENLGLGGGIYGYAGTLHIEGNTIGENRTSPKGYGGFGGGVYITRSIAAMLTDNWIYINIANTDGGGIYLGYSDGASLTSNRIYGNKAAKRSGGGVCLWNSDVATLSKNTIHRNMAKHSGGMYLYGDGGSTWSLTLTNNIVADNQAANLVPGMSIKGVSAHLAHTTIARNTGGSGVGVYVIASSVAMTNTILVGHDTGIYVSGDSAAVLRATLWGDGGWGNTLDWDGSGTIDVGTPNLWEDPRFVNPAVSDYHIRGDSPAVDEGVDADVDDDIDGDSRHHGEAPDLGADEATCLARVVGGNAYPRIQQAVDAATPGQTVQVAEGVCYENVIVTKTVTLEGGWDTAFTSRSADPASVSTIHGGRTGRVISITKMSGPVSPTIDGFTITGGDATGLGGSSTGLDTGGGIYSHLAGTTVADCIIADNVASTSGNSYGGGLGVYSGTVTLQDSVVQENDATFGGGVYLHGIANAMLTNSDICSNTAGQAGGLYLSQSPAATLTNNDIYNNTSGYGAGLWLSGSDDITLAGGIWLCGSDDATLNANWITNNTADTDGGGLLLVYCDDAALENNMVVENRIGRKGEGAGINFQGTTARLLHTTLARNTGGDGSGLHVAYTSTVALTNTILVSHTVGVTITAGSAVSMEVTLWGKGAWANDLAWGGDGAIDHGEIIIKGYPDFVDPGNGDYHIGPDSAALDAGLDIGVKTDIDGDPRPIGSAPDVGADEVRFIYLPLVMRNA